MAVRTRTLIVVLAAATAALAAYYLYRPRESEGGLRASGTIEATKVDVSFQISGRVVDLFVREGQQVKKGDLLARIAPEELSARVAGIQASLEGMASQVSQQEAVLQLRQSVVENQIRQAQGQADAARLVVERLKEGSRPQEIRVAEAAVAQAQADLDRRRNDLQRISALLDRGAVSQQEFDVARAGHLFAETTLQAARERLALSREGPRKEEIAEAEARLRSAQAGVGIAESGRREIEIQQRVLEGARARERELKAQLDGVRTQQSYSEIKSPIDGVVLLKNIEGGEVVNPGTPVVTIGDIDHLWMNVYISETKTGVVKLGQTVFVRTDSFPSERFSGEITFISAESEFTPKTIQTEEERVKLVYRVKVSLENTGQRLKPGMPADAEIVVQ